MSVFWSQNFKSCYQEDEEGEEEGDERGVLRQREEGGRLPGKFIVQLYFPLDFSVFSFDRPTWRRSRRSLRRRTRRKVGR